MRFITLSLFATLLSAPAFAADLGTYRPGTPYSSAVAAGADVCDNQCAGDAQCRGWNYVKPSPRAAGICEFLSSVSTPISSQISISGESQSGAPYYSGLTTGSTNTVRVGTQTAPRASTIRVGQAQAQAGRRVVRQAPTQQFKTQQASTRPIQDMSLTAQQNRYRQGQVGVAKSGLQPQLQQQPQVQRAMPGQRPIFRPILDTSAPQYRGQPVYPSQINQAQSNRPQVQQTQKQASRRVTGPRRTQGQGYAAPQFQDPRALRPQQASQPQQAQQPVQLRGQSRPPIGQPIEVAQRPARPQPTTPSQRLAQLTAQTRAQPADLPGAGPIALSPEQAQKSLFGRLNDDVNIPTASAVPTQPVSEQPLGEILAGGR